MSEVIHRFVGDARDPLMAENRLHQHVLCVKYKMNDLPIGPPITVTLSNDDVTCVPCIQSFHREGLNDA